MLNKLINWLKKSGKTQSKEQKADTRFAKTQENTVRIRNSKVTKGAFGKPRYLRKDF